VPIYVHTSFRVLIIAFAANLTKLFINQLNNAGPV